MDNINGKSWLLFAGICICLLLASDCFSQSPANFLQGEVTFITSANAYVRFDITEKINIGDTLHVLLDSIFTPCLTVKNKSSKSCVCQIIGKCGIKQGDRVIHPKLQTSTARSDKLPTGRAKLTSAQLPSAADSVKNPQSISGSVSASGYSNLSTARASSYRTLYRFAMNAEHIRNSKFSFETYLNYRQLYLPQVRREGVKTKYFNVYSLAVLFNPSPDFSIALGRKINMNASSIGAIDGIQVEKYFRNFFAGIIAGFRPDMYDQRFNRDLLEYGSQIGYRINKRLQSLSTVGLLEQKNRGAIDRRYAFFQHSSSFGIRWSLFSSFEMDLYGMRNGQSYGTTRLTNLYVTTTYGFGRKVNVSLTYDSRKRIIYFETFKTDVESLLENDEARQGARIRINMRLIKNTSTGLSYSKRFQKSGLNESDNINGFFSLNKMPGIDGIFSVYYNINSAKYLESRTMSLRYARPLFKRKLNADLYYRNIQYTYSSALNDNQGETRKFLQDYYGVGLSYYITKNLTFAVLGEMNTFRSDRNYRVNASLIKRFKLS